MADDILATMMKSIFTSISKKKGQLEVELKCNSIIVGVLHNIDSQLNLLLHDV